MGLGLGGPISPASVYLWDLFVTGTAGPQFIACQGRRAGLTTPVFSLPNQETPVDPGS